MQKENAVIKNYILIEKKRILHEPPPLQKTIDNLLNHEHARQNMAFFHPSLSRK